MAETSFYSDEALAKQAEAKRLREAGETVPWTLMLGLLAPRTDPEPHERCQGCQMDARDGAGGWERHGVRWCSLCTSRGRDDDYQPPVCWDPKCVAHEDGYAGNPDAPREGEFVQRHDGNSNIHIVLYVVDDCGAKKVTVACRGVWYASALRHANGDSPRQCAKCWEAMS